MGLGSFRREWVVPLSPEWFLTVRSLVLRVWGQGFSEQVLLQMDMQVHRLTWPLPATLGLLCPGILGAGWVLWLRCGALSVLLQVSLASGIQG